MITVTKTEKYTDRKDVREKIQNFADTCAKFYNGELSIPEYLSPAGLAHILNVIIKPVCSD